jgi:hypothetical protein
MVTGLSRQDFNKLLAHKSPELQELGVCLMRAVLRKMKAFVESYDIDLIQYSRVMAEVLPMRLPELVNVLKVRPT